MEAVESALHAGDRLDRYELLCPIASGGMATVWLARLRGKRGFEKLFAVKTIRTELVEDPRFQEMFLDEARITSGIQHPNVAQILDLGEEKDVLFIVMEWVDGDSLAKVHKLVARSGRTIPVGAALRIVADACAGLHAAHELQDDAGRPLEIVHRDVSPQNLLVSTGGAVKVIDFGIAKSHNRRQGDTRTGIVKGKLQYMAPEQVKKGRSVDRRADVWALGVCLHELVVGRLPNDGDDEVEVIRKLLADEAPQCAEGLPEPLAGVIARSIALSPDDRFATAAAMQRGIEGAMKELGASATSEDVAAFIASALPELAERRRTFVSKAIAQARDRDAPEGAPREEVGFAPTVARDLSSASRRTDEARAIALTKRKSEGKIAIGEAGGPRAAFPETDEPFVIPKRSRFGVWALLAVLLGAGAFGAVTGLRAHPGAVRWHPSVRARAAGRPQQPVDIAPAPNPAPPSPARAAPAAAFAAHGAAHRAAAAEVVEARPARSAVLDAALADRRDAAPLPPAAAVPPSTAPAAASSQEDDPNNPYSAAPSAPRIDP